MEWIKTKERTPHYDTLYGRKKLPIRYFEKGEYIYEVGVYNEKLGYWQPGYSYMNNSDCFITNIKEITGEIEWLNE